jgi:hypothetical protein
MKPVTKYCAFIDVLGYGDIVKSNKTEEEKVKMLLSIFMNLQQTVGQNVLKKVKNDTQNKHDLFAKSFSDCVYLESSSAYTMLASFYHIFSASFGYYTNFSYQENCTVLLRGGIVKDWTLRIMDIAALSRNPIEKMPDNEEFQNIIGQGVARAYYTSEKSKLSGMRIIISPEVLNELTLIQYEKVPFECYFIEGENLIHSKELPNDKEHLKLFILPIKSDEKNNPVNLFELCWPVYKYSWSQNETDIHVFIREVMKIKNEFSKGESEDAIRHLNATAEILKKSFEIAILEAPAMYSEKDVLFVREKLNSITNA